jgi:hypothetical protein
MTELLFQLLFFSTIFYFIISTLLWATAYQTYKPRIKWRTYKRRMKTSIGTFYNRFSCPFKTFACGIIQSSVIYLYQTLATYMQPIKKKRESNIKKGRQKGSCVWIRRKVLSLPMIMSVSVTAKCSSSPISARVPSEPSIKVTNIPPISANYHDFHSTRPTQIQLDDGAYDIIIDNGASRSITNDLGDFVGNSKPINIQIIGANATSNATLIGTVKWCIEDDDGVKHDISIPNTVYSAGTSNKLLSPQHWAQEVKDKHPNKNGTCCATLEDRVILFWNQQQYKRTAYLVPETSNVGVIRSAHNPTVYAKTYAKMVKEGCVLAMPSIINTHRYHPGRQ